MDVLVSGGVGVVVLVPDLDGQRRGGRHSQGGVLGVASHVSHFNREVVKLLLLSVKLDL